MRISDWSSDVCSSDLLEVAASGRALGAEVVVLERESRLLARVACEVLSTFFKTYHEQRGVAFELDVGVEGFVGENGHVRGVKLADGRTVACDAVVVGVGAAPHAERSEGLRVGKEGVSTVRSRGCP